MGIELYKIEFQIYNEIFTENVTPFMTLTIL